MIALLRSTPQVERAFAAALQSEAGRPLKRTIAVDAPRATAQHHKPLAIRNGHVTSAGRRHALTLLAPVRYWTAARKEAVLDAVVRGDLTEAEIEQAHGISRGELDEWARGFIAGDVPGLRATVRIPSEGARR